MHWLILKKSFKNHRIMHPYRWSILQIMIKWIHKSESNILFCVDEDSLLNQSYENWSSTVSASSQRVIYAVQTIKNWGFPGFLLSTSSCACCWGRLPSPQSYIFKIRKTWILPELPVSAIGQPHIPSTGVFGSPGDRNRRGLIICLQTVVCGNNCKKIFVFFNHGLTTLHL